MKYEKIFRDNLLRLMDERNLSKTELAELAGISVSFVSEMTTGKAGNPSLKVMGALARALKIPLPLLLYANPGDMWATWYAVPQLQADYGEPQSRKIAPGVEEVTAYLPSLHAFQVKNWARKVKRPGDDTAASEEDSQGALDALED